jgi:hypothetical protein
MFETAILSIDLGLLIGLLALQHRQIGVSVADHRFDAASKCSQLERQLILGQRLSATAISQHRPC